jgi:hypothetical protein
MDGMNVQRIATPLARVWRSRGWLTFCLCIGLGQALLVAAEPWEAALSRMPLGADVTQLDRTNCVPLMLNAFGSNDVVKALIFMPGATDEFYMFRRAKAVLTNREPTLLDAVVALTNQTLIRATFQPPFLLLHSDEDPLDLLFHNENPSAVEKFKRLAFVPHAVFVDRDWDYLQPILRRSLRVEIRPWTHLMASWHFYRHSFAAWNLNGWEAIEAAAYAGKTTFTVRRRWDLVVPRAELIFEGDIRARAIPTFTGWPR